MDTGIINEYTRGMRQRTWEPHMVRDHGVLIDPDTGEVSNAIFEHEVPKAARGKRTRKSRRVGMGYVMVDTRSIGDIELVPTEHRVLGALLAVADRNDESRSRISTTLLAQRCGMSAPNTSRVLTALRKRNIIFKEGPGYWRVSPWYAFAGEWAEWDKAARNFPEPTWKRENEDA